MQGFEIVVTVDEATGAVGALLHCPSGFAPDFEREIAELEALLGRASDRDADLPLDLAAQLVAEQQAAQASGRR